MRKAWSTIRANDWWSYKLPPLLAMCYSTLLLSNASIFQSALFILIVMSSIFVGAIYVSLINDITDIEEDAASGKKNRMTNISPPLRWALPFICIITGIGFQFFYWPDKVSMLLYTLPWISFTLYSCEPFRLKKKGIWGVIADASGSHLFISLLMVSSMSYRAEASINWLWFSAVAIWAFTYGLRGILYHQFSDQENDLEAGVNTFVVSLKGRSFKTQKQIITSLELMAFALMLITLNQLLPIIFLLLYLGVMFARKRLLGYNVIFIAPPSNGPFQIFMADYYQLFFPLSLLISATLEEPAAIIILLSHLILFPQRLIDYFKEVKMVVVRKIRS